MFVGLLALLIWHGALLYTYRNKAGFLVYAVFNPVAYVYLLVAQFGPCLSA